MRCMLLGYSFEPRPIHRALGTGGSVITIGLSKNVCSHSKSPFHARTKDLTSPEVRAVATSKF